MRPIDADALKKDLTRFYDNEVTARELIDEQPTVDVQPVKRGRWEVNGDRYYQFCPFCSNCKDEFKENGADEETLARCIFIGLVFGKLELMLFGSKDGDSE